jgi:two-component sensor histidine kinase
MDWRTSKTVGLSLVRMLCQQINGSMDMVRSAGTAFHLRLAQPEEPRE